jgi:hypothetical protein
VMAPTLIPQVGQVYKAIFISSGLRSSADPAELDSA